MVVTFVRLASPIVLIASCATSALLPSGERLHTDDADSSNVARKSIIGSYTDVFGVASQEINHHRNLDGIYTDVFGVAYGKKSLEEILFKMLLRKKYFREIAILNRFLGRLGPQILHEDFLQDFLRKQHET